MRQFHSYGPVDCRHHFCVEREALVQHCFEQLIGIPDEGGALFHHLGTETDRQDLADAAGEKGD